MEVEAAQVEARGRHALHRRSGGGGASGRICIHQNLAGAYAVPDRHNAESDRPVSRILPDRGIAVVHELIAVIFELLPKVIQHRPGLVTRRTAQAVLAGEGGEW